MLTLCGYNSCMCVVCVGAAKFVLLCQLYTSNRKEMNKSDRREVLEHLRAR